MKKIEILNIEIEGLDKPLTGSNMKRNGFSIEDKKDLNHLGIKEEQIDFWIFRPELTLNKEKLVKVVEGIKKELNIKFYQQKVLELNIENAMTLIENKYSKDFFLSMTVGETLILMAKKFCLESETLKGFKEFYEKYKKKCLTLKLYDSRKEEKTKENPKKVKKEVKKNKKSNNTENIKSELSEELQGKALNSINWQNSNSSKKCRI
jgi:hypothetical protein